ncbi:hypothetical protein [Nocardia huaxiensis]|nr:hypothetical protein [Nocardia huaxiensis]
MRAGGHEGDTAGVWEIARPPRRASGIAMAGFRDLSANPVAQ